MSWKAVGAVAALLTLYRGKDLDMCAVSDKDDPLRITDDTRSLGLTVRACADHSSHISGDCCGTCLSQSLSGQVCRGTAVMMVSPTSGMQEIANPFMEEEQE